METKIKTAHEEKIHQNEKEYIIGVLMNTDNENRRLDSFVYYYNENNIYNDEGLYIIFNTIIDLFNYLFYGEKKIKRAYITENKFDNYYDNGINGLFKEKLEWKEN